MIYLYVAKNTCFNYIQLISNEQRYNYQISHKLRNNYNRDGRMHGFIWPKFKKIRIINRLYPNYKEKNLYSHVSTFTMH